MGLDSPPVSLIDEVTNPVTPWVLGWVAVPCGSPPTTFTYRYGWDISDPDDDNEWSEWGDVLNAPPREFHAGVHSFRVEAKDETGNVTRGTIFFEVTQPPVPVKKATWGEIKAKFAE